MNNIHTSRKEKAVNYSILRKVTGTTLKYKSKYLFNVYQKNIISIFIFIKCIYILFGKRM